MRVGGDRMIPVDVRIIAATNEKLLGKVNAGQFRSDLYYRINIMHLNLPPLRERKEDIPLLMRSFADRRIEDWEQKTDMLYRRVENYTWPGNIRELQNYVWRSLALLAQGMELSSHFFDEYRGTEQPPSQMQLADKIILPIGSMKDMEREIVRQMMDRLEGNQSEVARKLKLSRNTVVSKLGKE